MKSVFGTTCLLVLSMGIAAVGLAQQTIGPDAGAKIRGQVTSSLYHQQYAQHQSRVLYYAHQITPAPSPEEVKSQAETIKSALAKSDDSLKYVKETHAKDPEVVKLVDSVLKHHAAAKGHCEMTVELIDKKEGTKLIADCCAEAHEELDLANKDLLALKKYLKVEDLPIPKKSVKK